MSEPSLTEQPDLRVLFDQLEGVALWAASELGEFDYVSDGIEDIWGVPSSEFEADTETLVEGVHPADRELVLSAIERSAAELTPESYEHRVVQPDGTVRWVDAQVVPLRDDDGNLTYLVGITTDITARKAREADLRRANDRISEQERILERLHEVTRELVRVDSKSAGADVVVSATKDVLGFPLTAVRFLDDDGEKLVPASVTDRGTAVRGRLPTYDLDGFAGAAYRSGEPWVCGDLTAVETEYDRGDIRCVMYVPIPGHGVISVGTTEVDAFDDADVRLAEVLASNAQVAFDALDSEAELEAARERLAEAQRVANLGHWARNVEAGELTWSEQTYRIFGLDPDEVTPTVSAFLDAVHPEDRERIETFVSATGERGGRELDFRIVRPDGEVRTVNARSEVIVEDGDPVEILGTVQDVTRERRLAKMLSSIREIDRRVLQADDERELLASARDVLAERDRYGCTAIAVLDDDGDVGDVYHFDPANDAMEIDEGAWREIHTDAYVETAVERGSYAVDDVTGPPHAHHPSDVESHGALVFALSYRGHDYGVMTLHLPPGGISDEERQLLEGVADDVAVGIHALRTEERIERENEELALLNRLVRHDIRNDMTVVLGFAELLAEDLPERLVPDVERIVETSRHTVELTKTARDLVEMTRGDDRPERKPVALAPAVADEAANVARSFPAATLDVGDLPEGRVLADDLLPAVFRNLLHNAVQHNHTPNPHVEVSATERDGRVVVRVADDGPGIPDSRKADVFGRGEKGLESPGSGMGLYLVDTLVEGYGGRVRIEDNDPEGSVFVVELDRAD